MKPRTRAVTRASAFGTAGVLGIGLLLLSGSAESAPAQYGILAQMKPTGNLQSADARLSVHATMTAKTQAASGGGITLRSHIDTPLGCASDTIFENGFDP
jgi:hypothetical protein